METEQKSDIIASFSQDASKFAFQANLSRRNIIDLYPLDPTTGYEINSSFVNHLDYENTEFTASDLLFINWCKNVTNNKQPKRKLDENGDGEADHNDAPTENFFINAFPKGQLVVYSSNGKDIVNIIRNRQEIIGMDTVDKNIWTLDTNKVVKIFDYSASKPSKTFTLIDGKKDEISNFHVCKIKNGEILIIIFTEDHVYIIDPSKRRPSTRAQFELFGGISAQITADGENIVIADIEKLNVYNIKTQKLVRSWPLQVERLKIFEEYIFALSASGQLNVFNMAQDEVICNIKVADSEVLDFIQLNDPHGHDVLIAWLNVNEPNFKLFSIESIVSNKEIIINEDNIQPEEEEKLITAESEQDDKSSSGKIANANKKKGKNKKATKQEQNDVVSQLISLIEERGPQKDVIVNLTSADTWNDSRITWFITDYVTTESIATFLFKCITKELQSHVYEETTLLNTWLRWLLILVNIPNSFKQDKENKKTLKHFRSLLKGSNDSLPILLGIQGRLDMLIRQAKLREELNNLSIEDEKANGSNDADLIEKDEAQNENEDEENMVYVNGETDVFVDAQE